MSGDLKERTFDWQQRNADLFYELADLIWENPEIGLKELNSSKLLADTLKNNGFSVCRGIGDMPSAFVAAWGCGKPVMGFSAEFDALPGVSQEVSAVRSPLGDDLPGHGCGHNILGTAAIKAAISIKELLETGNMSGTVKVFGTPAEELCVGKPLMAKAGCFEDVDLFLDWHPLTMNRSYAEGCNAYFSVKYRFTGHSSHGNQPWNAKSAFDACILQGQAVELLREHFKPGPSVEASTTINYIYSADGHSYPNVVPNKATSWYIGRFETGEQLIDAVSKIDQCAESAALMTGTAVKKVFLSASHEKIINETLSRVMQANLELYGGPEFSREEQEFAKEIQRNENVPETGLNEKIMPFDIVSGSVQDTSEYSWFAPYALLRLTLVPDNLGWHNWIVTAFAGSSIAHKCMDKAAVILAATAIDVLENSQILNDAKKEMQLRMAGKKYINLFPEDFKLNIGDYF